MLLYDFRDMADKVSVAEAAEILGMDKRDFGDAKAVWIYGGAWIEEYLRPSGFTGWRVTICQFQYDDLVRENIERRLYLDWFLWEMLTPVDRTTKVLREALLEYCAMSEWTPGKIPALEGMTIQQREWLRHFSEDWLLAERREFEAEEREMQQELDNALEDW